MLMALAWLGVGVLQVCCGCPILSVRAEMWVLAIAFVPAYTHTLIFVCIASCTGETKRLRQQPAARHLVPFVAHTVAVGHRAAHGRSAGEFWHCSFLVCDRLLVSDAGSFLVCDGLQMKVLFCKVTPLDSSLNVLTSPLLSSFTLRCQGA